MIDHTWPDDGRGITVRFSCRASTSKERIDMSRMKLSAFAILYLSTSACFADSPVTTARPVPATRPEMKAMLEDMKNRPYRIPLPELTDKEKNELGERSASYEARVRYNYVPAAEGTVFGAARLRAEGVRDKSSIANAPRLDFASNADENMTLTYQFKTMLFWIVSRTNNCQYCLGHQEWKLSATGMKDDAIAALDADWSAYSTSEQAAFAYARLLTYEPQKLTEEEFSKIRQHYTPLQILEMTMSMSGNNSINRWKEGIGIPQSAGNTFAGRSGAVVIAEKEHADNFTTPTSEKYQQRISVVAPLDIFDGKPSGKAVTNRPSLESADEVRMKLQNAVLRVSRLPLVETSVAKSWLNDAGQDVPVENWIRLLANFPNEGRGRLPSLVSREKRTGELTELQKAQLNWIIARQDRAWYAVGQAKKKLMLLGQTEDQIFALDGDRKEFSESDQALFTFSQNLAASPIALTDDDASLALTLTSPAHVVQTINHVASCAYFNRVTEAAGLPLE